jgi:flagellar protein FlaJ
MTPLSVLVYLLIPLSNAGFVVALDYFTGPLGTAEENTGDSTADTPSGASNADGATGANGEGGEDGFDEDLSPTEEATIEHLAIDERTRLVRSALGNPIRTILDRPVRVLFLTVPPALCWFVVRAWLAWRDGALAIGTLDDTVVGIGAVLLGTFALVHELRRRRIERVIPELLDRLASLNAVGVSIVEAFDRLGGRISAHSTPRSPGSIAMSSTARASPTPSPDSTSGSERPVRRARWPCCGTRCVQAGTSLPCSGSLPRRPGPAAPGSESAARRWRPTW